MFSFNWCRVDFVTLCASYNFSRLSIFFAGPEQVHIFCTTYEPASQICGFYFISKPSRQNLANPYIAVEGLIVNRGTKRLKYMKMHNSTWNRFSIENLLIDSLLTPWWRVVLNITAPIVPASLVSILPGSSHFAFSLFECLQQLLVPDRLKSELELDFV